MNSFQSEFLKRKRKFILTTAMLYDNNFKNYETFVLTVSIFFMNKISMVL